MHFEVLWNEGCGSGHESLGDISGNCSFFMYYLILCNLIICASVASISSVYVGFSTVLCYHLIHFICDLLFSKSGGLF